MLIIFACPTRGAKVFKNIDRPCLYYYLPTEYNIM
jgi:hypothetical protein